MNKKNPNILHPNPWRIILIFVILFVVFEAIFFISFQGIASDHIWPPDASFAIYTPSLAVASVVFCVLSIVQTSYEVTSLKLVHTKMGKVSEYFWSDIIYIDEEFSARKKMLLFYTKDGRDHFLAFDKKGIIYEKALEKSHLLSKEEFQRKFPNKKI